MRGGGARRLLCLIKNVRKDPTQFFSAAENDGFPKNRGPAHICNQGRIMGLGDPNIRVLSRFPVGPEAQRHIFVVFNDNLAPPVTLFSYMLARGEVAGAWYSLLGF
jgi:hypothetical protein